MTDHGLRVAATDSPVRIDTIADLELGYRASDFCDDSSRIVTRCIWQCWLCWIGSRTDIGINRIHSDRFDVDIDLLILNL